MYGNTKRHPAQCQDACLAFSTFDLGVMRRVRKQRNLASAQDFLSQLTLIERVDTRDTTGKNLSGRGHKKLEELWVLVVDTPILVLFEWVDFFPATPIDLLVLAHRLTLLDFGFDKFDVLANDGIVLLETKLVWRLTLVLHRRIKEAGTG